MRITQQSIVQNTQNLMKSNQVPIELKALVGKILEGKITGIQSDQTATFTSGDMQLNVSLAGVKLHENQSIAIKILDLKDGTLVAKLALSQDPNTAGAELLSKLGLNINEENLTIVQAMKDAVLPMSKENFQMLRQSMVEVKALLTELSMGMGDTVSFTQELDTPIKQLALKMIQANASNASNVSNASDGVYNTTESSTPKSSPHIAVTMPSVSHEVQTQKQTQAQSFVPERIVSNDGDDVMVKIPTTSGPAQIAALNQESNVLFGAIENIFSNDDTSIIEQLLQKFDYSQSSLILKNELPLTLKNIFLAYDALSDEGGITNKFLNILNEVNDLSLSKESISELLKHLTSEAPVEEKLDAMMKTLIKEAGESETATNLEREFTVLKESQSLSRSLNEQMMTMQIPIVLKDELQKVDIFYKKTKQKANPNDMTLLIALDTKNYGEVRCVIHKLDQLFKLDFMLKDEDVKKVFEQYEEVLKTQLKDKNARIRFSIKSNQSFGDGSNENDAFDSYGFDMKV